MEEGNLGAFKLVHGMARVLCQRQRYLTTQLSELMEELEELEDDAKPALTRDLGDLLDRYTLSE
jgi:hypothetical protein